VQKAQFFSGCNSHPAEAMTAYRVGLRVNSPKNNDAACVAPMAV